MKTTISKTVTEEVELPEFPFYLKKGKYQYFKIINDNHALAVKDFHEPAIEGGYPVSIAIDEFDESKIITEEQFKKAYKMILKKIEKNL